MPRGHYFLLHISALIICPYYVYFLLLRRKESNKEKASFGQTLRCPKHSPALLRHSIYRRYGAEILPILAGIGLHQACDRSINIVIQLSYLRQP